MNFPAQYSPLSSWHRRQMRFFRPRRSVVGDVHLKSTPDGGEEDRQARASAAKARTDADRLNGMSCCEILLPPRVGVSIRSYHTPGIHFPCSLSLVLTYSHSQELNELAPSPPKVRHLQKSADELKAMLPAIITASCLTTRPMELESRARSGLVPPC
jgi:hypothetical protein